VASPDNWLKILPGRPGWPCVILIHGLGVNADFWFRPERVQVMAGLVSLSRLLHAGPDGAATGPALADALVHRGYALAAWTQSRPVGQLMIAVDELDRVVAGIRERLGRIPLVLVGHSRGGLVARAWLARGGEREASALITIGTPHGGSTLASWTDLIAPVAKALDRLNITTGAFQGHLRRLWGFRR